MVAIRESVAANSGGSARRQSVNRASSSTKDGYVSFCRSRFFVSFASHQTYVKGQRDGAPWRALVRANIVMIHCIVSDAAYQHSRVPQPDRSSRKQTENKGGHVRGMKIF